MMENLEQLALEVTRQAKLCSDINGNKIKGDFKKEFKKLEDMKKALYKLKESQNKAN